MTYRKLILLLALVAVSVGAAFMTGWAFSNYRESHGALRDFDVQFSSIERRSGLPEFDVVLTFGNAAGATRTTVEFMGLAVYHRDQLIVSHYWFPEDFTVPPQETLEESFTLESNLQAADLADLTDDGGHWEARMRLRVTNPAREGAFVIDVRRKALAANVAR